MAPSTSSKGTSSKSTSSKSRSSKSRSSKSRSSKSTSSKSTSSKSTSSKSTSSKSTSSKSTSANKSREEGTSSHDSLLSYSSSRSNDEYDLNQCICCGKCFTTEDLLIEHIEQNHPCGSAPCIRCNLTDVSGWVDSDSTKSVLWHMYYYHSPDGYLCEVCDKYFDNHGILSQHMYNTNHRQFEEFACLKCGAQFPIVDYKMHSLWHKIKVVCDICRKMINSDDFTEHQNTHINQDSEGHQPKISESFCGALSFNEIPCPSRNCDMIFTTKRNLILHFAEAHGNSIFYICNMCTETFPSQEILRRHQRIHHHDAPLHMFEKPQFAIACNKKYDELDLYEIEELVKDPRNKMTLFKVQYATM